MPIYEYQCAACGYRGEELQKMSARPLKKCPECGGKYEKQISSPSFQFKGTGWYVTDYAKKGGDKAGADKAGADAEAKTTSKDGDKSGTDSAGSSSGASKDDGGKKESKTAPSTKKEGKGNSTSSGGAAAE